MTDNPPGSRSPGELEQDTSLYPGTEEADHAVWHEDLPPADDFHDEGAETEAEVEDSPPAGSEEEDQISDAAEAQKRGRKVLLATVGVVALVVGGLAFNQFSKPSVSGNLALPIAGMTGAPAAEPAGAKEAGKDTPNRENKGSVAGMADLAETPKTAEADITAIYNAGADKTIAPTANKVALPGVPAAALTNDKKAEVSQTTDVMTSAPQMPQGAKVMAALPPAAVTAAAPANVPLPSGPNGVANKGVDKGSLQPLTMPKGNAAPNMAAATSAVTPEMTARLNDLTAQMETLRKSVEQMSQQTQALAAKAEATHGSADVTALVQRLNDLEAQLAVSKGQKKVKDKQSSIVLPSTTDGAVAETTVEKTAKEPAKEVAKTSRAKKPVAAKKAKTKAALSKTSPEKGKWILRAATPDAAWVASSKETTTLRQVRVGDTLPGVGKIRAINQNGASWEVVGSKGSIR